jgi:hypothetical protein
MINNIQFEKLVNYTKHRLLPSGLTLSKYGISEMLKRFAKEESDGGYSIYWKTLP